MFNFTTVVFDGTSPTFESIELSQWRGEPIEIRANTEVYQYRGVPVEVSQYSGETIEK